MPKCHQCLKDLGSGQRNGDCKVCYSKGVDLCQVCAMWELGPCDADVDLPAELLKAEEEAEVQRQEDNKPKDSVAKIGDEPLECDVFFATMEEVCPFFKDQLTNAKATLYTKQFQDYTCSVLKKFRELYPSCKYDRLAIQVLLAMHLSAQERVQCRDQKDSDSDSESAEAKFVKRWQTREIAVQHLKAHLPAIQTHFGKSISDIVGKETWLLALGMDNLEFFLKGFKHPTLMAIDLLAAAGSVEAAREALEVGLIVYHSLTATRSRGEVVSHWSAKRQSFNPTEALGFVSKRHFEALYGDVDTAKDFSDEAKAKIDALWNVLGDVAPENKLPAHPRYADGKVTAFGALEAVEVQYLQYLPTFDHPESEANQRTACETAVRARVLTTMKTYLSHYGPERWFRPPTLELSWVKKPEEKGTTKTLKVREKRRGAPLTLTFAKAVVHATSVLVSTEKAKIQPFIQGLLDADDLRANGCRLEIEIEGEEGNDRRAARKKAVEDAVTEAFEAEKEAFSWRPAFIDDDGAFKDDAPIGTFVDDLCEKMKSTFIVDQAFGCDVTKRLVAAAQSGQVFEPKAWFPVKTVDVDYIRVFPDCFQPTKATLATIDEHYTTVMEGTRPGHYMDWRNHKDHWLYDCFVIKKRRRPLFGSLSVQPFLPGPNPNYGGHILFYERDVLEGRAVFTFGDKQQPRRSMLLTLDTIMHGRKKKDGAAKQGKDLRQKVLFQLLRRADVIDLCAGEDDAALWQRTMGETVPYPDGDLLIECQVFGGADLTVIGRGVAIAVEDGGAPEYMPSKHLTPGELLTAGTHLGGVLPDLKIHQYRPSVYKKVPQLTPSGKPEWDADLSDLE
ncbi:MAG: hypothetical protein U0441_03000 [Polyangiaceae bacterium]